MFRITLLTILWMLPFALSAQIEWSSTYDDCYSFSSPRAVDLNNDDVLDIVLGAGIDGESVDNGFLAINGVNGETLWSIPSDNQIFGSASFLNINNDGIPDIIIGGRDAILKAIDGSTGASIWDFYTDTTTPPGDNGYWNFYNSQVIADQDGDGTEDILVANGGNHALPNFETDRPPGHLMVISGATGTELAFAQVPDGKETYMSPLIADFDDNGVLDVIFGTGGEFIEGSLWRTTLTDVMNNDLSGATELLASETNGFIAPPSLVDINLDGTTDVIVNAYDGRVVAISGLDNSILWAQEVPGTQTNSSPAIGFFNDDSIPDVFSTYAVGQAPAFTSFIQLMIDGATGNRVWEGDLGIFHFSSPLVYDVNEDGIDEVILSYNEKEGDDFFNSIVSIDFNASSTTLIVGPNPGVNINSTPWIGNMDQDGILDLVSLRSIGTTFATAEDGIYIDKYSLDGISDASIVPWGAYMGTNHDGQYTSTQVNCNFELELSSNNNNCFEGNNGLAAVVSSGCPNPEDCDYLWSNGSTEQLVSNLPAGSYVVDVTHPNGCTLSAQITITEPSTSPFELTVVDATCANQSDGSITIENLDPSFEYDFNWNTGSSDSVLENLSVGDYTVFFTDQNDCFIQLDATITSTPAIEFAIDFINISCNGETDASITIDSLAGIEPLQVIWTGDYSGNDLVLEDLAEGTYNLEIIDGENCNYTETFEVVDPTDLQLDIDISDESCPGQGDGSVTADIIGGTPPYTIMWEQSFIGPTFSQLFVRGNLPAGAYTIEVRDWNNCLVSLNIPINTAFGFDLDISPASGFGVNDGAITLDVVNGTPPYSVEYNGQTISEFPHTIGNLNGGDELSFVVSDASDCLFTETVIVPFGQGIQDVQKGVITCYPNPAQNVAFVSLPADMYCPNYRLFSNTGNLLLEGQYHPEHGLDLSVLAKGLYYVDMNCQKSRFSARLVKL